MTAKNYEAWDVKESDYPADSPIEEKLRFLLRYAILAPSGPNTQPWKFAIHDSSISVFADLDRALQFVDPSNRALYMSVGCAIANLAVTGAPFACRPKARGWLRRSLFSDTKEAHHQRQIRKWNNRSFHPKGD